MSEYDEATVNIDNATNVTELIIVLRTIPKH